ncbi:MAG: RnfABCDGE type electron transport complex subunit D [Clostridia bacterium]|nr:RnfABCDGE type electron transport complex subunit D [Clostridia bacterium]
MKYVNSGSPQIRDNTSTKRIMIDVCIALLPATIVGIVLLGLMSPQYGIQSAILMVISVLSAVASEFVFKLVTKVPFKQILNEFDFTSVVTGMLVGMNLYQNSKWYAAVLCSVFAIVVVKMLFGGTGKNIVNPAIAGRIFGYISFGAGFGGTMGLDKVHFSPISYGSVAAGATPLQAVLGDAKCTLNNLDLFLGTGVTGCIGEISKVALLLGGVYLVCRGVLNFRWPLVYIALTGVTTVVIELIGGAGFAVALDKFLPSILSGGLFLGAIFMATDYVTAPVTKLGKYIYFALLGIVTAVLRDAVGAEVVSFVILLGNLIVPLIDGYIVRRPFGYHKPAKEGK